MDMCGHLLTHTHVCMKGTWVHASMPVSMCTCVCLGRSPTPLSSHVCVSSHVGLCMRLMDVVRPLPRPWKRVAFWSGGDKLEA